MSSILKALKKLEKETLEQRNEPRLAMGLNIRSEKSRRKENSRDQKKGPAPWIWIVSSLLIFLGAGTLIIQFSHDRKSQAEVVSNNASTSLKKETTAKPKVAVTDSPQFTDSRTSALPPHSDQKIHDKPPPLKLPPPRIEQPQASTNITPSLAETQKSNIPMDHHSPPPEPPNSKPLAVAKTSPPVIAQEAPEPTVNEIPSLSDNSLTINAIAWSNDPAKRLAVINSLIVRQGQSVGEFLIVKIEEDQVIVQQSYKKWRVVFRLQ